MRASFTAGWRQVAAGFALLTCSGMITSTYTLVAVPLSGEFETSRMVLMLAMTVLSGTCALLMPLLGSVMDRVSLRKLMLAGALCLGAGFTAVSFATAFEQVLAAYALLFAPANVLIGPISVTVLLSRWFVGKRGRALGIAIAGVSAGGLLFPMVITALFEAFEWRVGLRVLALILLAITIPAALLVIDRPQLRGLYPDGANSEPEGAVGKASGASISARLILSDPMFWLIAGTVAIVTAGMKGMVTNLAPLAIDRGLEASEAALLVSIFAACAFVAKLTFAALADKVGARGLMFTSLGGFALGMACLTQAHMGFAVIAAGVAIIGIFAGLMIPTESYLAPLVFGEQAVGRAMGLLSGTILLALLATPPMFGLVFDITGSYTGIFWVFCGLALAALLWVPFLRLHPRSES